MLVTLITLDPSLPSPPAVMYECVLTAAKIYPSSQLIEIAAGNVGRFLRSGNNNLKYLGITALAAIVSVNPVHAADYKGLVIDCLDDPDETLKRKTLDLLGKMTNPANVKVIVEKLVGYLKSTVDMYLRKDLVPRIIQLADRFSPDNVWYVEVRRGRGWLQACCKLALCRWLSSTTSLLACGAAASNH